MKSCSQKLLFEASLDFPIVFNLAVRDDTRSHCLEWRRFVFALLRIDLLNSENAVKVNINKFVTGFFSPHISGYLKLYKSLDESCVLFLGSACWTCPPIWTDAAISMIMSPTFVCDLRKILSVLRAPRSMFMLKCS